MINQAELTEKMKSTLFSLAQTPNSDLEGKIIGNAKVRKLVSKGALGMVNAVLGKMLPFATRNGLRLVEAQPGRVVCKIPIKINRNHFGAMYAGAIFTLAEIPVGLLAIQEFDAKYYPILKEMKVQFLKVAKTDLTIDYSLPREEIERMQEVAGREGKCEFEMEGQLKDEAGEIVAKSFGIYQVRSREQIPKK